MNEYTITYESEKRFCIQFAREVECFNEDEFVTLLLLGEGYAFKTRIVLLFVPIAVIYIFFLGPFIQDCGAIFKEV